MKVFAINIDGQYFQELVDSPKYNKGSVGGTHSAFYHAHDAAEFNIVTAPEKRTFDKRTFKSYFAAVIDKIADKDISINNLSVEISDE